MMAAVHFTTIPGEYLRQLLESQICTLPKLGHTKQTLVHFYVGNGGAHDVTLKIEVIFCLLHGPGLQVIMSRGTILYLLQNVCQKTACRTRKTAVAVHSRFFYPRQVPASCPRSISSTVCCPLDVL